MKRITWSLLFDHTIFSRGFRVTVLGSSVAVNTLYIYDYKEIHTYSINIRAKINYG